MTGERTHVIFQGRAAYIQDNIRRKLIKNMNTLIGLPEEVLAIKTTKNRDGDIETRIVKEAFTAQVNFPPLQNIPVRYIERNKNNVWSLTSLVNAFAEDNEPAYTIQCNKTLSTDDIICRTFLMGDKVNVVCFEVTEILADFGGATIINNKYKVVLYTQEIHPTILEMIVELAKRRAIVQY
jgi:hypothetical protein